ncbi:hypothetical protein, partial [Angustibacter aerolatus]
MLERTDLAPVQRPGGDLDPAEHDPARLDLVGLGATAATSVAEALQHVVGTAVRALDAQLAALWLPGGRFAVVQRGWSAPGDARQLAAVASALPA